jgi:hypothetical protein
MAGELQVAAKVGELLYLRGEHGGFGDVLLAATDAVAGLGEEGSSLFRCNNKR